MLITNVSQTYFAATISFASAVDLRFLSIKLSPRVNDHCVDIFAYSVRHGYMYIADIAAEKGVTNKYHSQEMSPVVGQGDLRRLPHPSK